MLIFTLSRVKAIAKSLEERRLCRSRNHNFVSSGGKYDQTMGGKVRPAIDRLQTGTSFAVL